MRDTILSHLRGARRSLTVWFAAVLAAAPEVLAVLQANFPTIAPFIPQAHQPRVLQSIALAILLLRMRTDRSLAAKAGPTK